LRKRFKFFSLGTANELKVRVRETQRAKCTWFDHRNG